jgi:hypothetical protein
MGRVLITRRRIGSAPDSAFEPHCHIGRDSIWVVWQDARRGELDIYGAIVPLDGITGVGGRKDPQDALALAPNPATDRLRITVAGHGEAAMIDLLGNVVRRASVDDGGATIDVRDLRKGVYVVRVRTGSGVSVATVRVLR